MCWYFAVLDWGSVAKGAFFANDVDDESECFFLAGS